MLEVQRELHRLLGEMPGTTRVLAQGDALPDFAWHCPLLSLPLAFGTELATIPAEIPYLRADLDEAEKWRLRLAEDGGDRLRVALVWAGNPKHVRDLQRSIRLAQFAPLSRADVQFHSLQKGPRGGATGRRRE